MLEIKMLQYVVVRLQRNLHVMYGVLQVDFAPYLDILADELDLLYWDGVEIVHASTKETFTCRAMLLSIVTDYRGMPEIFRTAQSPAFIGACYVCGVEGWRMATKTCYSGKYAHVYKCAHVCPKKNTFANSWGGRKRRGGGGGGSTSLQHLQGIGDGSQAAIRVYGRNVVPPMASCPPIHRLLHTRQQTSSGPMLREQIKTWQKVACAALKPPR